MEFGGLSAEKVDICSPDVSVPQARSTAPSALPVSGSQARREQNLKERWSLHDLLVLVQAKREADERLCLLQPGCRKKSVPGTFKWHTVRERMEELGVVRTVLQLRKRWDRLVADFKKVYDYKRHSPSGHPDYYSQDRAKRREMGLPLDFPQDLYKVMVIWVPRHKNIESDPEQVIETEDLEAPASSGPTSSTPTDPTPATDAGDEDWMTDPPQETDNDAEVSHETQNARNSRTPKSGKREAQIPRRSSGPSESPSGFQGVTRNYEKFGQKRSRKSLADAEVRSTVMPLMLEQMTKGLEAYREMNIALIEIKGKDAINKDALLKLKEKEIESYREGVSVLSSSMDKIARSIEFLAKQIGSRMAGQ